MPEGLRRYSWPLAIAALATVMFVVRVHSEMADFAVYRTAAVRALDAEPLYRASDGHYQYKYLPAFALAMAASWVPAFDFAAGRASAWAHLRRGRRNRRATP